MWLFALGCLLFFGSHLLPTLPRWKQGLRARLGGKGYQALFSLTALTGLVLLILGYPALPRSPLWSTPGWAWQLNPLLMLGAALLLAAAYVPGNLKRSLRHPMLSGILLWSLAHLLVAGHLAALLLFGLFATYALLAMASANQRGARRQQQTRPWFWDLLVLLVGVGLYLLALAVHGWLGKPVPLPF